MRVAIVENYGKDFYISRMRLANYIESQGHQVVAVIPDDGYKSQIEAAGFEVKVFSENIRGKGIFNKLTFAKDLYRIFKRSNFEVIHCFRMQPNIIGAFVAGLLGHKKVYNHITGLGIVYTKNTIRYKFFQQFIKFAYRFNNKVFKTRYIFQNKEDVRDLGIKNNYTIIRGSATNESVFFPKEISVDTVKGVPVRPDEYNILFVSRLLRLKGLDDLVKAVLKVNAKNKIRLRLLVAGWIDEQNANSHTKEEIEAYQKNKAITFLGSRNDIDQLIAISDLCVLPTYYREGTPRFLLEAMASAKPIITTDMPGCNHLVKEAENGFLVEKQRPDQLVEVLEKTFVRDFKQMGEKGRQRYLKYFSENIVYSSIENYYNNIL